MIPDFRTRTGRWLAVVAVVALVAASGCSALSGSSPGGTTLDETTTGRTTATDVATEGTTAGATTAATGDYPAGIDGTGIEDREALLSSHAAALTGEGFAYSFGIRRVARRNGGKGVNFDVEGTVRATRNLSAHRRSRVIRHLDPTTRFARWANDTAGFARRRAGDGTTYESYDGDVGEELAVHHFVDDRIAHIRWSVSAVHDNGTVVLVAEGFRPTSETEREERDRYSVSGRLVVDSGGWIRSLRANVTRTHGLDGEVAFTKSRILVYRVTRVGNVSVSAPDWVDAARNATRSEDED